eukprot:m.212880 g.212880  ORF g.212880 m.212880 type:complete len:124 (-) comp13787_c0_seq65:2628-2999(-)
MKMTDLIAYYRFWKHTNEFYSIRLKPKKQKSKESTKSSKEEEDISDDSDEDADERDNDESKNCNHCHSTESSNWRKATGKLLLLCDKCRTYWKQHNVLPKYPSSCVCLCIRTCIFGVCRVNAF